MSDKYKISINQCSCHPETCACSDYKVVSPEGKKMTFMHLDDAKEYADDMNELLKLRTKK